MPIVKVNSMDQFYSLFKLKTFEYISVVVYSPETETRKVSSGKILQKNLDKCWSYLDKLSNSDKYSHVIFVEVNCDALSSFTSLHGWPEIVMYGIDPDRFIYSGTGRATSIIRDMFRERIEKMKKN